MLNDVRSALRQLKARPLFASLVTATIGVSLGLGTAAFSLFDAILIRPLPYPDSGDLVRLQTFSTQAPDSLHGVSLADLDDWRAQDIRSIGPRAAWVTMDTRLTGQGPTRLIRTAFAAPELFDVLGVRPVLGRTFNADENRHGGDVRKVVISHALWQDAFGGAQNIVGTTVEMRAQPHEVIGVLPARFDYPDRTQAWMPLMGRYVPGEAWWQRRDWRAHGVLARLRPGATVARVDTEMNAIAVRLAAQYPDTNRDTRIRARALRDVEVAHLRGQVSGVTLAAVMLCLLGCVNVAGLFVARAAGRSQEFAIRTALGAGRGRLCRQHASEGLIYGALGGAAGIGVAYAVVPALQALVPEELPTWMQFGLDVRALGFAGAAATLTALLIGAASLAWHLRPTTMANTLRQGDKGQISTVSGRVRQYLTVVQVALSVILLVGTGLMVRSLVHLGQVDTGVTTTGVLVASVTGDFVPNATREETIARHARGFQRMRDALAALPGVDSVSAGTSIPFLVSREERAVYELWSRSQTRTDAPYRGALRTSNVMPGYFTALGMRILEGRDHSEVDTVESPPTVVISRRAGELLFPGEHPLGRQVRWGVDPYFWATVVGIVPDTAWHQADAGGIELYFHHAQFPAGTMRFLATTALPPESLAPMVRRTLQDVNADFIVERVAPLNDLAYEALWQRRLWTFLFVFFGSVAVALTCVGLFGVMSYLVTQRTREFGVRLALGATPESISGVVFRYAVRMAAVGIVAGLVMAVWIGQYLESLLFGISRLDAVTFIGVPVVIVIVLLAACAWPAWRASRVDPLVALRDNT